MSHRWSVPWDDAAVRPRHGSASGDAASTAGVAVWRVYLAVGMLAVCAYLLIPTALGRDVVYLAVGLASVGAICFGLARNRPAVRAPWLLFAAGQLAWVVGDSVYSWNMDVRGVVPFPSVADIFYLGAYPLLAAGIGVLIHRRGTRLNLAEALDSAIVVVGIGLVSWAWVARPILGATAVPALERGLAVAYPVCDIVLLAMVVRLVSAPSAASTALRVLVGAISLQIVADTALAAAPSTSWNYSDGLDLLWLTSYVLWGASALHPQMSGLSRRVTYGRVQFTRRRLASLSAAALLPPATFVVAMATGRPVDATAIVVAAIVLTSLVLARMACAISEIRVKTEQRDRLQDELFHQAAHDPLTDLFNRAYMIRLIDNALRRGRTTGSATGLALLNLDQFTTVNDDWGPATGDLVLQETARRIAAVTDGRHLVGRLGDDQFVMLVETPDAADDTTVLAARVLSELHRPYEHEGELINVTGRIGVSVSLDAGTDAKELLREAHIANRRAKVAAAGTVEVFDNHMRREQAQRTEIESALRRALRHDELELHYQPVVAATTDVIDGYEALIRWHRSIDDLRMPADFIPIAEKSDLICDIGRWALREATRQFADWKARDPERFVGLTVAVNISGRHLADHRIVADVSAALAASGLPAYELAIEVTETVLIDVPHAIVQLGALRDLGVTISLDDFGTGYTSIGQLRDLPVDTIKIDQSFLHSDEPGSSELIALMTAAAHACGMLVVAEGVERVDQLDMVKSLDCDAAQGHLFSRPLPAVAVFSGGQEPRRPRLRVVEDPDF